MKSILCLKWLIFLVTGVFGLACVNSVLASVGEYQKCTTATNCTVGEFLYDDEYVPIIDAECTLTSRYPDGTVFINSSTLPPSADGWYSYSIGTSGLTLGLYRSHICCTSGADYLCLDKSFTISQDTAESVWNYNNRTISSFGNLASDVWSYSNRSLTGFGTLIRDIWNDSDKALTTNILDSGSTLVTKADLDAAVSLITGGSGIDLSILSNTIAAGENTVTTIETSADTYTYSTIVTNPSQTSSYTTVLKYYLPQEVGQEDISGVDDDLNIAFDTEESAYFITGQIILGAGETRLISVSVNDVWQISVDKVESIKTQAAELLEPLKNTSYFAQGAILKSDIDASLAKAMMANTKTGTPEDRIRNYRQAIVDLLAAENKLDQLKSLVTQAGSTGTLFGFIGGVQALSVWGLIIVLVAGFVFLALYMKTITPAGVTNHSFENLTNVCQIPVNHPSKNRGLVFSTVIIVSAGLTIMGTYFFINQQNKNNNLNGTVLSAKVKNEIPQQGTVDQNITPTQIPTPTKPEPSPSPTSIPIPTAIPTAIIPIKTTTTKVEDIPQATVIVPSHDVVYIYSFPSFTSKIIGKLDQDQTIELLTETLRWTKAVFPTLNIEGWVSQEFVQK